MKIAVVYNRESKSVINIFGVPNREKYGLKAIKRITDALKKAGHQVIAIEGDKALIQRLEEFMPQVLKGERPGMVFNLSYGIQGQARYTHVPGILEMIGIPYVGSGPLAHSLSLDKVVAKMLFRQHGLPTPEFVVLDREDFELPEMAFPLIVKPKNESTSFGLKVVQDEAELRAAVKVLLDEFQQAVLVESYIEGREINVGLIGNNPPEAFPPAELVFGDGPQIYTLEDKKHSSGRTIGFACPAPISEEIASEAREIASRAFTILGCADCIRADFRLDGDGKLYLLEVNSLPSLGEHGSYTLAAERAGLDFAALVNRLVDVASTRYFGMPAPPTLGPRSRDPRTATFAFLTERRDLIEKRLEQWVSISSRTSDPIGIRAAFAEADARLQDAGMVPVAVEAPGADVALWQSRAGFKGGVLLIGALDVPLGEDVPQHRFRREPEWLFGEGIGSSRAPLVSASFALRALKARGVLKNTPVGVLLYADEGLQGRHSADFIRSRVARAGTVLVLDAGTGSGKLLTGRRGLRRYRLVVEAEHRRLGDRRKGVDLMPWLGVRMVALSDLTDRKARIAVSMTHLRTTAHPTLLPHRATGVVKLSYTDATVADRVLTRIREVLGKKGPSWSLELLSDRPPMTDRPGNQELARELIAIADSWDISLAHDTSTQSSVAGLIPEGIRVVSGMAPQARDLHTPQEAVQRISVVQHALILAEFLGSQRRSKR